MKKSLKLDLYTYIRLSESLILTFPDHIHSLLALIAWVNSKGSNESVQLRSLAKPSLPFNYMYLKIDA